MDAATRLRASRDFDRVRARGRAWRHPLLTLHVHTGAMASSPDALGAPGPQARPAVRCGLVVSRRVGGAVIRNRVRRRLREIVRPLVRRMVSPAELVLAVRPAAAEADFATLREAVTTLVERSGLLPASVEDGVEADRQSGTGREEARAEERTP